MSSEPHETWTPGIIFEKGGTIYATIMVEASRCARCRRVMVTDRSHAAQLQPVYHRANLGAQIERAGWCFLSGSRDGDSPICKDCEREGGGHFLCSLCGELREGRPVEWWDGDALCGPCYETVPAKVWDEKLRELEKSHRYDHC